MTIDAEQFLKLGGQIVAALSAAVVVWKKTRLSVSFLLEAWATSRDLRKLFGPQAASAIKTRLDSLTSAHILAEKRHELVCSHLEIGVYVCSENGHCIYASPRLCHLFRRSPEEMMGFGWTAAIHPKDRGPCTDAWQRAVRENLPYEYEYRVLGDPPDIMHCRSAAVKLPDGRYVGYVVEMKSVGDGAV